MAITTRVISIGALAAHPLRGERTAVRTGHATTTLVQTGDRSILIDPGLPAQAVVARLEERTGLAPDAITDVVLTRFSLDHARGLPAFDHANWWIGEAERESVGVPLVTALRDAMERAVEDGNDPAQDEAVQDLQRRVAILQRCQAAPDSFTKGVDLFPLHGVSPGLCGVLVSEPASTTLICGDAIPTVEHLERGLVLPGCFDTEAAQESVKEAMEIADVLVLGRDNWHPNRGKSLM